MEDNKEIYIWFKLRSHTQEATPASKSQLYKYKLISCTHWDHCVVVESSRASFEAVTQSGGLTV